MYKNIGNMLVLLLETSRQKTKKTKNKKTKRQKTVHLKAPKVMVVYH